MESPPVTKLMSLNHHSFLSFKEAHKMVREANVKQAAAEKQLKEAHGKVNARTFFSNKNCIEPLSLGAP